MTRLTTPTPPLLRRWSSDEYQPLPWTSADRVALAHLAEQLPRQARRLGVDLVAYSGSRRGTASLLRAVNDAAGERFYDVPAEAETDLDATSDALGGGSSVPVVDVQTHLAVPSRLNGVIGQQMVTFLEMTDPERWQGGVHASLLTAAEWIAQVFGNSETAVAVLTSTPGVEEDNLISNDEIRACREIVDRYAGTGRVRTHTIVHPNVPGQLEAMEGWRNDLKPAGWKAYTMWEPAGWHEDYMAGGWFLDDEAIGLPFLEQVRKLGPRVVAVHKGIGGPIPGASIRTSSPRDVGPVARLYPDITFLVYHSGYEPDPDGEEGPYTEETRHLGVNRLIASMIESGVGPGANVYAELGSTWFMMVRKPREAAHVLGKLLKAFGPDRILWGTDCIWYGSPQPLIDSFRAFQIPEWMQHEYGYPALTPAVKDKILATNAAAVYNIDLGSAAEAVSTDRLEWLTEARVETLRRFP